MLQMSCFDGGNFPEKAFSAKTKPMSLGARIKSWAAETKARKAMQVTLAFNSNPTTVSQSALNVGRLGPEGFPFYFILFYFILLFGMGNLSMSANILTSSTSKSSQG